ncbi:MAG: zf-HC2 domain-containing protein [Nitrosomonas sp.]|nr:zf-HC2 domain-containing protein [Nitrosomonas sp.]
MLNCKQASQLASRSMDEKLPLWKNMVLKIHLILCRSCTNFTRQLVFLREASRYSRTNLDFQLTEEARQRIANALKDMQNG